MSRMKALYAAAILLMPKCNSYAATLFPSIFHHARQHLVFHIPRGSTLALTSKTNALFTAEVVSSDISPHIEGLDTAFS